MTKTINFANIIHTAPRLESLDSLRGFLLTKGNIFANIYVQHPVLARASAGLFIEEYKL